MLAQIFERYGEFCAGHPLEVIVTIFTLTACILNMEIGNGQPHEKDLPDATYYFHNKYNTMDLKAAYMIVMMIIRFLAALCTYYQCRNLEKMGSKYILGIAGLFTVFSSVVFTSSVMNFGDVTDLQ